jgi:hypothetical protein
MRQIKINARNETAMLSFILLIIAYIVFGPFLVVWSWNTLFGEVHFIEYTFKSWLAVVAFVLWTKTSLSFRKDS